MEKFKIALLALALVGMIGWAITEVSEWQRLEQECLAQGGDEWTCGAYTRID